MTRAETKARDWRRSQREATPIFNLPFGPSLAASSPPSYGPSLATAAPPSSAPASLPPPAPAALSVAPPSINNTHVQGMSTPENKVTAVTQLPLNDGGLDPVFIQNILRAQAGHQPLPPFLPRFISYPQRPGQYLENGEYRLGSYDQEIIDHIAAFITGLYNTQSPPVIQAAIEALFVRLLQPAAQLSCHPDDLPLSACDLRVLVIKVAENLRTGTRARISEFEAMNGNLGEGLGSLAGIARVYGNNGQHNASSILPEAGGEIGQQDTLIGDHQQAWAPVAPSGPSGPAINTATPGMVPFPWPVAGLPGTGPAPSAPLAAFLPASPAFGVPRAAPGSGGKS